MRRVRIRLNGDALIGVLARKHMTQNELSKILGLSSGMLSQYMTGARNPSAAMRKKMMRRLSRDISFDELFIIEVRRDGQWERV
jgi:transcriptional regulator with XRE-family HTH domain